MADNKWTEMPSPDLIVNKILTRDFSEYEAAVGDTAEAKEFKRIGMAKVEDLMDCWTDKIVPAVGGARLLHPKIRHFEPMTTSLMPRSTDQLRVTASTEAMAALIYLNNHTKWNAMRSWAQQNAGRNGAVCPRYNAKKPTEHVEFKALYSDNAVGTNKWGGWSTEGKKMFVTLQKKIIESRRDNLDRHVKVDKECVERLYHKFADMHKNSGRDSKKAKAIPEVDPDEDDDLDYVVET